MSASYVEEFAPGARLALQLAEKEVAHLRYTYQTLYAQPIDLAWVERLEERKDLGEKIDAFVSRYARLQDHLGEKLLPAYARLLGGQPKTLLDVLAYAERMGWLDSAAEFVGSRRLRNLLVHEYMQSPSMFLEALLSAKSATETLMTLVERLARLAEELGVR